VPFASETEGWGYVRFDCFAAAEIIGKNCYSRFFFQSESLSLFRCCYFPARTQQKSRTMLRPPRRPNPPTIRCFAAAVAAARPLRFRLLLCPGAAGDKQPPKHCREPTRAKPWGPRSRPASPGRPGFTDCPCRCRCCCFAAAVTVSLLVPLLLLPFRCQCRCCCCRFAAGAAVAVAVSLPLLLCRRFAAADESTAVVVALSIWNYEDRQSINAADQFFDVSENQKE